jgi:hypothetical protein
MAPRFGKLVAFASPNREWFNYMRKKSMHMILYMPVWTWEELCVANEVLQTDETLEGLVDTTELERRFNFFGGTARECFANGSVVWHAESSFVTLIEEIQSAAQLKSITERKDLPLGFCHRLFHLFPGYLYGYPQLANVKFCSNQVASRIFRQITEHADARRREFAELIRDIPGYAGLAGQVFELIVTTSFSHGVRLDCVGITPESENMAVIIPERGYVPSPTENYESIDGYYYNAERRDLYLFQCTVAETHPVSAEGIYQHLVTMGVADDIDILHIRLVFVIPEYLGTYALQQITLPHVLNDTDNVSSIRGIGPESTRVLARQGIQNVGQLAAAFSNDQSLRQTYGNRLDNHMRVAGHAAALDYLARISQFYYVFGFVDQ